MVVAMTVEAGYLQKGLSEWWNEESLYILRRIEKWTAIARGYNRLKSHKLQSDSLEIEEEDDDRLNRSATRSPNETRRINCCGTFNYQSNSELDSNCLETYRYDHSIYFKTIGDIRRSKSADSVPTNSCNIDRDPEDEQVEWDARTINNLLANQSVVTPNSDVRWDYLDADDREIDRLMRNVWPIVDLGKLSEDKFNNNVAQETVSSNRIKCSRDNKTQELSFTRFLSFRRSRRTSRAVRHPKIFGDNNVSWPGVLLSYKQTNMDPALSASLNRMLNVK